MVHRLQSIRSINYRYSWSQLVMCIKNTSPQHQFVPFQPFHHHGREQRSVKGPQGQECRPAQSWNGLHDHQQEARTVGAIIRKWKKYQMKICCPQSGAPYKTLPHDVRSIMRIVDWPKTTQVELCMITRHFRPQAARTPLATHYAVIDWYLAWPTSSPCSSRHMCSPVLTFFSMKI